MSAGIMVFACNWDGWSSIDAAASAGLTYPVSVNVIKLPCLSSINSGMIVRAFEYGIDGVLLLGCQPHECQHGQCGDNIEKEYLKAREILQLLGIDSDRIQLTKIEPFDGEGFVSQVNSFMTGLGSPATVQ